MGNIETKNHPAINPIENRESLQKWVFDRYKIDALWLMLHGEKSIWEKIAQDPEYFSRFLSLSGKSKQILIRELERSTQT